MSKDRPILFSGEMVRAILAGDKTQTRRVVNAPWRECIEDDRPAFKTRWATVWGNGDHAVFHTWDKRGFGGENGREHSVEDAKAWAVKCAHRQGFMASPYGQPGDTLWVRETWRPVMYGWSSCIEYAAGGSMDIKGRREYDALHNFKRIAIRIPKRSPLAEAHHSEAWHPSIHMPRWASRITLRVTSVRVERLHDITEEDARAEGVRPDQTVGEWLGGPPPSPDIRPKSWRSARDQFSCLWDENSGKRAPWSSNPWVWVIGFEREGTR